MDFELSPQERAFETEVEAFLQANHSPEVMDRHPEQLSQTVDSPAKRSFIKKLADRGASVRSSRSWPCRPRCSERRPAAGGSRRAGRRACP